MTLRAEERATAFGVEVDPRLLPPAELARWMPYLRSIPRDRARRLLEHCLRVRAGGPWRSTLTPEHLLDWLRAHAETGGQVLAGPAEAAADLEAGEEEVAVLFRKLVDRGVVRMAKGRPVLVDGTAGHSGPALQDCPRDLSHAD